MSVFNRRNFLNQAGRFSLGAFCTALATPAWSRNLQHALEEKNSLSANELATDEEFWHYVQQAYTSSEAFLNFNNGGVSPSPKVVQDAVKRYMDISNEAPSFYMWRIIDLGREQLRRDLAALAGCLPEELALQRNATESLETIIFGLPLKAGDEVVLCKQDYPSMVNAWKQRATRDGIKLVWVDLDLPSEDNDYLAKAYTSRFTPRTRLVHITHMINWNGQILPVRNIADAAHARGIEVLVDGAQSFAQFAYTISDLGADYYGASLHKWLSACIGTGILFVKKEKIEKLYPLFAAVEAQITDIRKFEHQGTRPFFIEEATGKAIDFHLMIGAKRKAERLHYLKNYWMEKVKGLPGVQLGTSMKPEFGCAIGLINIEGMAPRDLDNFLFQKYRIHTTVMELEKIKGVRISPHVYTSTRDLDTLVMAITEAAKSKGK